MPSSSTISRPFPAEPRHPHLYHAKHPSPIVSSISKNINSNLMIFRKATSPASRQPCIPRQLPSTRLEAHQAQATRKYATMVRNCFTSALSRPQNFRMALFQLTTRSNFNAHSARLVLVLHAKKSSSKSTQSRLTQNLLIALKKAHQSSQATLQMLGAGLPIPRSCDSTRSGPTQCCCTSTPPPRSTSICLPLLTPRLRMGNMSRSERICKERSSEKTYGQSTSGT
jgi:hypothetical protein